MHAWAWLLVALRLAAALPAQQALPAAETHVTGSVVTVGPARFSFLTPEMVRLEWSQTQKWSDWPSAIVLLRQCQPVAVHARRGADGWVTVTAAPPAPSTPHTRSRPCLTLRYRPPGRFSPDNLVIEASPALTKGLPVRWRPGHEDPANLGGTRHSLDGVSETALPPLPPGLLSRSGYFFIDDSQTPLINPQTDWLAERPDPEAQDWYFCAYGHDYLHALRLASDLLGHIPIPPRWAFGAWYSRYWPYHDQEERALITRFRTLGLPLDVLVLDVDWHLHGWEGYDWNPELFPDPLGFLRWVHAQGCKVTLNNHPGPLPAADSHFAPLCRRLGLDPTGRQDLWLNLADQQMAAASFELLRLPLHQQGVDFWWIDGSSASFKGLDSQMWTSKVYFEYTERFTGKRGLLFARYGGLGSHRYPVGFSGDTYSQWGVLAYEVGFTSRAGNVLYPYWSHDIGGFLGDRLPTELYVRWVQFGALSPILRLHSNHGVREPWEYGDDGLETARRYFRLRYELLPYLYSWARRTYETGLPLCRPLYLHWPELEEAYQHDDEYLLGEALLVAPIVRPAPPGQPARRSIWLPPGLWIDWWTGDPVAGPTTLSYEADLHRLPLFLRGDSILVMGPAQDYVGQKPDDPLRAVLTVGSQGQASFTLYEDDGESKDYQRGAFALTPILWSSASGTQRVRIGPTRGTFAGQLERRAWALEVRGQLCPQQVLLDGKPLPKAPPAPTTAPHWSWDEEDARLLISLPVRPLRQAYLVELRQAPGPRAYELHRQARALANLLRTVTPQLSSLPGQWAEVQTRAQALGGQLTSLAHSLASSRLTVPQAARTLSALTARQLAALLDRAAQATPSPDARFTALSSLLGLRLSLQFAPAADGRSAEVRPETATPLPPLKPLAQRFLASLHTPTGQELSACTQTLRFTTFYPVGLLRHHLDLVGTWAGLPLRGQLVAAAHWPWLQLFHLVGPFDNSDRRGLDAPYPPEQAPGQPLPTGAPWEGKAGPVQWLTTTWRWPTDPTTPHFINLQPLFKPSEDAVAYAAAYLWAPQPMPALALLGSDDECKLWLNGQLVHQYREPRPPSPDQDRVPLSLRAGWNVLLLKICQEKGQWGFYLRLATPEGGPLEGLWTSLTPEGQPPAPERLCPR
jgi:hypothetical protein